MKKVIVTGGTKGFGLAYANLLKKSGAKVIAVARSKSNYNIDLSNINGTHKLIFLIEKVKPDLVILNAGFGWSNFFENYSEKDIINMQYINGTGKAIVLNHFFSQIKNKNMKFIVASSIAGKLPSPLMASYSASKAYCSNLISSLNGELISQNINNLIIDASPGNINTENQTPEVTAYAEKVLVAKKPVIFNKDIYYEILEKSFKDWESFVKSSFNRKLERINAK